MKLILIILLLMISTFASEIKKIQYKFGQDIYIGDNHMIPQKSLYPKVKDTFRFMIKPGNIGTIILDDKNKKAWEVGYGDSVLPINLKISYGYCNKLIDKKSLKNMDLNLLNYLLEKKYKNRKDITILVQAKKGENNNPYNLEVFSITQNKYLKTAKKSASICEKRYEIYPKYYNQLLEKEKKIRQEEDIKRKQEEKQEKINIKKRKTIQVADDTDQGMILQIKGPLVLVQTEICTIMNDYGVCLDSGKTTEWVKRKNLTFKNQK